MPPSNMQRTEMCTFHNISWQWHQHMLHFPFTLPCHWTPPIPASSPVIRTALVYILLSFSIFSRVFAVYVLSPPLDCKLPEDGDHVLHFSFRSYSVQARVQKTCPTKTSWIKWSERWYQKTSPKWDGKLPEGHLCDPIIVYVGPGFPFLEPVLATLYHYSNFPALCLILPGSRSGH